MLKIGIHITKHFILNILSTRNRLTAEAKSRPIEKHSQPDRTRGLNFGITVVFLCIAIRSKSLLLDIWIDGVGAWGEWKSACSCDDHMIPSLESGQRIWLSEIHSLKSKKVRGCIGGGRQIYNLGVPGDNQLSDQYARTHAHKHAPTDLFVSSPNFIIPFPYHHLHGPSFKSWQNLAVNPLQPDHPHLVYPVTYRAKQH